jgi:methionyl aminopeptidase
VKEALMSIRLKTERELEVMRKASKIVAFVLEALQKEIKPKINTYYLDRRAEQLIKKMGGIPAFKGYNGFPGAICASINEEIVHGIPDKNRILREGDLVKIDVGVGYKGYFGDGAATFIVGKVDPKAIHLVNVTRQALYKGIEKAVAGNRLYDISHAIQEFVETHNYSVVRNFVGHGVGENIHEEPEIPNFVLSNTGPNLKEATILEEGMTLAIEPMVNEGTPEVEILDNNWTAVTKDRKLSAHFEHTVFILENGPEIATEFKYG